MSNDKIITRLNEILRAELAGAMMYLHYSFYIYGHARIPIVGWLREQSSEGMTHATEVGDQIIYLGGDPETHPAHDMYKPKFDSLDDMLRQTLKLEKAAFEMYANLLKDIEDSNLMLRVFLENKIMEESGHIQEIELMLRPDVVK
jgi:bacterioferritin (cytochrome b1)